MKKETKVLSAEGFIKDKEVLYGKPLNEWNRTTIKKTLNEFADLKHQSKLDEVTNEMIENYSKSKEVHETEYMDALSEGRNDGAKWLLKHLKRTES